MAALNGVSIGNLVRVAPNMLVTSSPELWTHVNKDKRYTRSEWFYKALRFEHRRDNVFSQTDNEKHDQRRKQMMPGVSPPPSLKSVHVVIIENSNAMVTR